MFNNRRLEELEKKVELILNHLGLEYQPRLVDKGLDIPKDIEAKVEAIAEIPDIETLKAICPFYHKNGQMIKEPKEKIYKVITKACKDCGKEIESTGKKQYCDACIVLRRQEQQKKYAIQRHERTIRGNEILSQEKKEQSNKDWEKIDKGAVSV